MLREISSGSVKILSIQRDELLRALEGISQQIQRAHREVKEIWLFGSVARGDQVGTSDVDILIVVYGAGPADRLNAALDFASYFALPVGVDLLVMGEMQVEKRLTEGDPFVRRIYQEGRPLGGGKAGK